MCGIFGLSISNDSKLTPDSWRGALKNLFLLSESRGKEAAGIAIATEDEILIHKDSVSAGEMIATPDYQRLLSRSEGSFFGKTNGKRPASLSAIGHARLVTNGLQGIDANNQPIRRDDIVIIHNGIVVNVDDLWAELEPKGVVPQADVDTEVIAAIMQGELDGGHTPAAALVTAFKAIYGESSIAVFIRSHNVLLLGTNTGSMHVCLSPAGKGLFFASERSICEALISGPKAIPGFEGARIVQIKAGRGAVVSLDTHELDEFDLSQRPATPQVSPMLAAQRRIEDKAERYRNALKAMRRCSKCLLPETMPFIAYDANGVCNYCHTHQPWLRRPESELEEILDARRSKDGTPDCIVAFSGGRDSSYGLHVLKTKYRMTPLTFSYDWGMVTDLARRNQARMCGKLGIEHIWISADIKKKRAHIRRNVLAWLKKPDLGLIPLFMAGDKAVFWHANKLMETYQIPIMVLCTNRYEKTDFKQGFLDVDSRGSTIHRPSSLSSASKVNMLWQYGKRFAANPAYFNRSMPDTMFAFFSYYVIKQNYFSLFDFIEWDEDQINKALIEEYDWELAKDSKSTWRIGDGTAPFYNYIYATVAGFTEYDTFRSHQIREGKLDRAKALAMLEEENQPRWDSIREYTQLINIDFDEAIRAIDRIPKRYVN